MAQHRLAEVLKKKRISKRRFAAMLDMDYPTIFRYFRKGYDPKLSTLTRWAKALKVSVRSMIKE